MGDDFLYDIPGNHRSTQAIDPVDAGDATEEQLIFVAPTKCTVKGVAITPDADVTGNDTNTKNLNVVNKGSDGTGSTEIANLDLATGTDLSEFDRTAISASLDVDLEAGDSLTLQIEQVGSGVAIPRSLVDVDYHAR